MAKLIISEDFTLEVGEDVLSGSIREFTKQERKEAKKSQQKVLDLMSEAQKLSKDILILDEQKDIEKKLNAWDNVKTHNNDIKALNKKLEAVNKKIEDKDFTNDVFKARLVATLEGDDTKAILDLGEKYGYQLVFETIQKDIQEKKS